MLRVGAIKVTPLAATMPRLKTRTFVLCVGFPTNPPTQRPSSFQYAAGLALSGALLRKAALPRPPARIRCAQKPLARAGPPAHRSAQARTAALSLLGLAAGWSSCRAGPLPTPRPIVPDLTHLRGMPAQARTGALVASSRRPRRLGR